MLSTLGITCNELRPRGDNAGGIAEMARSARRGPRAHRRPRLLGNTTASHRRVSPSAPPPSPLWRCWCPTSTSSSRRALRWTCP
jgi:hypothetical protein